MSLGDQEKHNNGQIPPKETFSLKGDADVLAEETKLQAKPKRLNVAAILLVAAVAKLLIWPVMQVAFYEFKHRSGHGWDDSRAEFQQYYEEEYKKFGATLPVKYAADLASCQSNSYVAWLNKSECRRYRISFITSAAEHARQTAACLSNAGESEFVKANSLDCVKQTIPNKWGEFESVYTERFFSAFQKDLNVSRSESDNKRLAGCVAKKYIEKMTSVAANKDSECGPMNLAGGDLESLMTKADCQQVNMEHEMPQFAEACLLESATAAH